MDLGPTPPTPVARRPRRLRRVAVSVVAVGGLALAACGSPPTSGDGGGGRQSSGTDTDSKLPTCPLDALEKATGTVKVNLWYGGLGGVTQTTMEDMAKRFNASQDKVEVTANNQGRSYQEVLRKYEGASSTPSQLPEIVYLEDTALGELVDKGQVLPAQSCMEADDYDLTQLTPAARSAWSVDGVLYPGYMNVSTPILYYNKAIFKKAGLDPDQPPRSFDEIRAAAEKIKAAGLADKPLSFKVDGWFFETWMAGVGQDMVDNDNGRTKPPTKATFNTPEGVEILTFLSDMRSKKLLNAFAATEGSIDHYLALLPPKGGNPQSAMLVETSTASTTISGVVAGQVTAAEAGINFDDSVVDKASLVPGSAALPGLESPGKVFAGGGAFYILNTSSKAEQAASWAFLKFMLQPENAKTWHVTGSYLPVVKSVLDEADVKKFWETDLSGVLLKNAVDQLQLADPDQARALIGPYVPFAKALQGAMEDVVLNGADPKTSLATANKEVNKVLDDYNGN